MLRVRRLMVSEAQKIDKKSLLVLMIFNSFIFESSPFDEYTSSGIIARLKLWNWVWSEELKT